MWWLQPISWIRWIAAALVIVFVAAVELARPSTVAYPFAAETIVAGADIAAASIEWRDVPEALLPATDISGIAQTDIAPGTPITPDRLVATPLVPAGWWLIELPVGRTAPVGSDIRIVVLDPMTAIDGVLTAVPEPDPFGGELLGTVAIPPQSADLVARATASNGVVTLVGSHTSTTRR